MSEWSKALGNFDESIKNECFDESIKNECFDEPLIDKIITTENNNIKYILTIKLYKANYDDCLYWNVKCNEVYQNTHKHQLDHPFRQLRDHSITDSVGGIVVNNEMIMTLMKYLAMDDDELTKYIGNNCVIDYRANIIAAVDRFWD